MKPGGTLAIIDWFKKENLKQAEYEKFIHPIEKGMLVNCRPWRSTRRCLHQTVCKSCKAGPEQNAPRPGILPGHHQKKIVLGARRKNGPCVCGSSQGLPGHESRLASGNFIYGLLVAQKL